MLPRLSAAVLLASSLLGVSSGTAVQSTVAGETPPAACPITKPPYPPYIPPPPYSSELRNDWFRFGTDELWVDLPANGTWPLGHYEPTNPAFRQKLFWYREGYEARGEPNPRLIVTGKRIDAWAPPMGVDGPNSAWVSTNPEIYFMTVGLNFSN
jgi:hypothetical protein